MRAGTAAERLHALYMEELRQSLLPPDRRADPASAQDRSGRVPHQTGISAAADGTSNAKRRLSTSAPRLREDTRGARHGRDNTKRETLGQTRTDAVRNTAGTKAAAIEPGGHSGGRRSAPDRHRSRKPVAFPRRPQKNAGAAPRRLRKSTEACVPRRGTPRVRINGRLSAVVQRTPAKVARLWHRLKAGT